VGRRLYAVEGFDRERRKASPVSVSRTMRSATRAVMSAEPGSFGDHLDDLGADELESLRR
jgi:hypothetical protein